VKQMEMKENALDDCKEIGHQLSFLDSLANGNIAMIAPVLTLSRMPDVDSAIGTSIYMEIMSLTMLSNQLLRAEVLVDVNYASHKESHTLYTLKEATENTVKPFICIMRDSTQQIVTVFESPGEFMVQHIEGDEMTVLKEIRATVEDNGMYVLLGFIDLVMENIKQQAI